LITNKQLYRLKDLHTHTWDHETADALAAAIATLEGLPVTSDGAHVTLGDDVYLSPNGHKANVAAMDTRTGRPEMLVGFAVDGWNARPLGAYSENERAYSTAAAAKGGEDA
jgi:hypothetical protein